VFFVKDLLLIASFLFGWPPELGAATVVFDASHHPSHLGYTIPFGRSTNAYFDPTGVQWQQVHKWFYYPTVPFLISDIGFVSVFYGEAAASGQAIDVSYDVTISLGVSNSKGTEVFPVFSGLVNVTLTPDPFDFDLIFHLPTPFNYDPRNGSLVFDVFIHSHSGIPPSGVTFKGGDSSRLSYSYQTPSSSWGAAGTGTVTAFSNDGLFPQYGAVPEPGTFASLAVAVGLLASIRGPFRRGCEKKAGVLSIGRARTRLKCDN
jgi:hypothetical protein